MASGLGLGGPSDVGRRADVEPLLLEAGAAGDGSEDKRGDEESGLLEGTPTVREVRIVESASVSSDTLLPQLAELTDDEVVRLWLALAADRPGLTAMLTKAEAASAVGEPATDARVLRIVEQVDSHKTGDGTCCTFGGYWWSKGHNDETPLVEAPMGVRASLTTWRRSLTGLRRMWSEPRATVSQSVKVVVPVPTDNLATDPRQKQKQTLKRAKATQFTAHGSLRATLNFADWGPIVLFSSSKYYHREGDEYAVLRVLRLGNLQDLSEVQYRICDSRLEQPSQEICQKITFEVGQNCYKIEIPLAEHSHWLASLDFTVELLEEGLANAELGHSGRRAEVRVESWRRFPLEEVAKREMTRSYTWTSLSRKFEKVDNQEDELSMLRVMAGYIWWNLRDRAVRVGTIKLLAKDQLHNAYFVFNLILNVYLVDSVLSPTSGGHWQLLFGNHGASLVAIMTAMVLPIAVLHLVDYTSISWRVAGKSRALLQAALVDRFMKYDETSRLKVQDSDLVMAVTRDTTLLVSGGYMTVTKFAAELGKVALMMMYQLIAPLIFGKPYYRSTVICCILPTVLLPTVLVGFLIIRRQVTRLLSKQHDMQNRVVDAVFSTVMNYHLIADYGRRGFAVRRVQEAVQAFNNAALDVLMYEENDVYFSTWVTAIMVAVYTGFGGLQVLDGRLNLGMFLTGVKVLTQSGQAWVTVYRSMLQMQMGMPGLMRIVELLNLGTDQDARIWLQEHCIDTFDEVQEKQLQEVKGGERADKMPIIMEDITCTYMIRAADGHLFNTVRVKLTGRMQIEQGQLVSLVGPRGGGKSTLLKVLGGAVLPDFDAETGFFLPGHLRVLHIASEPMFFVGSLRDNLTFGVQDGDPAGHPERVLAICRRLGLHTDLLDYLDREDGPALAWNKHLSQSQRHLLSLARALIADPDVLAIHKPTLAYDEKTSLLVLRVLEDFVRSRGVVPEAFYTVTLQVGPIGESTDIGLRLDADCTPRSKTLQRLSSMAAGDTSPRSPRGNEMLKIEDVGHGLVQAWNRDPCSHVCVKPEDWIVRVLVDGDEADMAEALRNPQLGAKLQLVIRREIAEHTRRPHTCVVTSSKKLGVERADAVFYVNSAADGVPGVQRLEKNSVTEDMLR